MYYNFQIKRDYKTITTFISFSLSPLSKHAKTSANIAVIAEVRMKVGMSLRWPRRRRWYMEMVRHGGQCKSGW
jgi:hypothetical protein